MKTISSHVTAYMKNRPLLIRYLHRGIINYRALAKYIEPEISKARGEKVSIGAIAVSLQRLRPNKALKDINTVGLLKGVSIYSGLNLITVGVGTHLPPDIFESGVLAMTKASKESSLIVTNDALQSVRAHLPTSNDVKILSNLAAIGIERTGHHLKIAGGLVYPLNVLLENNIPVICVASTENEELILVENALVDKASALLRKAVAL